LVALIGSGDAMRDYCIAWALGWCGDSAKKTLNDRNNLDLFNILYREFYENPATPKFVKRIAWEAILKLSDRGSKDVLRSQKIRELPIELQELVRSDNAVILSQGLQDYLLARSPIQESIQAIDKRFLAINYYSEWRSNKQLQAEIKLELNILIKLLDRPYPETIELSFNLVCDRYNPNQPDRQLILALVNCNLSAARDREDTRAFAKRFLSSSILNENATRVLIGQIIAHLLAFSLERGQISSQAKLFV
jgi:hypothetical protein